MTGSLFFDTKAATTIGGIVIIVLEYYSRGRKKFCAYHTRWYRRSARYFGPDIVQERFDRMFLYRRLHEGKSLSFELLLHAPTEEESDEWKKLIAGGLSPVLDHQVVRVRLLAGDRFERCTFAEILDQAEQAARRVRAHLGAAFPLLQPKDEEVDDMRIDAAQ